jgi:hypothetical protein
MKNTTPLVNHNSQSLITKTFDGHRTKPSAPPVFALCDRCYWCATYFSNARIPTDNICTQCNANSNIVKLPHRVADNDKYDYAYDYNYYITEDDVVNLDNKGLSTYIQMQ